MTIFAGITPPAAHADTAHQTPTEAVAQGARHAAKKGVTQYVSVIDRSTGAVLAETANANDQVASESIAKLIIAAYRLRAVGGYKKASASLKKRITYMIQWSDNATATALFSPRAAPSIAAAYGMHHTQNATDRTGHWGAMRITAHDMATFMYEAAHDPKVGPWLINVMAGTKPTGVRGFNQKFGLNALTGTHGSKQGWGDDSYFTTYPNAINSVGYTSKYDVAILTIAKTYPDPARSTSTYTAQLIQASVNGPPADGTFVKLAGHSETYRVAGGAPVYIEHPSTVGGAHNVVTLTSGAWQTLRDVPVDGTWIRAGRGGDTYQVTNGAPVPGTAPSGQAVIDIDPAAIDHAGGQGPWAHLRVVPGSAPCTPFPDVNRYNTHCTNIVWLSKADITKPADGLYHPLDHVTRGQMAAFLFRLTHPGAPQPACAATSFSDVDSSNVFCGYITWAAKTHVAQGYDGQTYRPGALVTRGAMAAFLHRVVGGATGTCTSKPFDDVATDGLFCGAITWAKSAEVTYGVGNGDNYGVTQPVTRQAMASFLHRADGLMTHSN